MTRAVWVAATLIAGGCGGKDEEGSGDDDDACTYPDSPTAPVGALGPADDCGYWAIAVGGHLVADLPVAAPEDTCEVTLSAGLVQPSDEIFSNFGTAGPKWTIDVVGEAATDPYGTEDVACTDGTGFRARVAVE